MSSSEVPTEIARRLRAALLEGNIMVRLSTRDGHELEAYVVRPTTRVKGGVVIAQEMYGVNNYLRSVCDFYAAHGYAAAAPALYDRKRPALEFPYDNDGRAQAQRIYKDWDWNAALDDLDAGCAAVADAGKVGLVGFCWGGTLAWLAACRRAYACTVAYYGSMMPDFAVEQPRCPVIAHIGDRDTTLPPDRIERFRVAHQSIPIYMYLGARHGFDNANRVDRYDREACRLAHERTLEFLAENVG